MDQNFWVDRWQRGEIGFHQAVVNAALREHWPLVACPPTAQVFVPLCGKSVDMHWLCAQGHGVIGIDLAAAAVAGFFVELELQPARTRVGRLECWRAAGYTLFLGDFFELGASQLAGVQAVYDRAALIALPPALRARYATHLAAILPAGCRMLLLTMDYPQQQMPGPPFAVAAAEVRELFAADFSVTLLATRDALLSEPRFQQRGLQSLQEQSYLLVRQS